jgi:ribosomal protein S3AE
MLRITDRNRVPKDQYNFTVPESGRTFAAHVPSRLFFKVREYQAANNYRVWTEQEIEEDYCKRHLEQCNDGVSKHIPVSEHDDFLTRVASAVGIPAADALSKLSAKLGVKCQSCNRRHQIIRKMREIGFSEALRQLKETL